MKTPRLLLAALLAASAFATTALAGDINGNWKWTSVSKNGEKSEVTAALKLKDNALTGMVTTRQGPAAISDASFKDGVVSFTVSRTSGPNTTIFKYTGKLADDTLSGTMEKFGPAKDTPPTKKDWLATRSK